MTFLPLVITLCLGVVNSLHIRECNRALGMESGTILDSQISASSSFDQLSTGPQNARVRLHSGGGAWCPKTQINTTSMEYLEIEFPQEMLITAVESQGRDDNGQGAEYAENYRIEYWRSTIQHWARYTNGDGSELVKGNLDTRSSELTRFEGGIVVKKIRIIPVSKRTRTVCMRVELYGCPYKGTLVSYSIPEGHTADGLQMKDFGFDGTREGEILGNGLGKLYDGVIGADNFEKSPSKWIGWRIPAEKGEPVVLNFTFPEQRNFSAIAFHTNNHFKMDAEAFSSADILFSQDGNHFSSRIVHYKYHPDRKFDTSRWIRIPIPDRIGRVVQARLTFSPTSSWLLISEVKFESDRIAFEFEESQEVNNEVDIHHSNSITYFAVDDDKNEGFGFMVTVVIIAFCFLIIACCGWRCAIQRKSTRSKSSPSPSFNAKQPQIHLMIDGSSIKRVSPSTYQMAADNVQNALLEKLPMSDCGSEYADPDMSCSTDCSSTLPLLRAYHNHVSSDYAETLLPTVSPMNTLSSPLSCQSKYAEYGEVYCTNLPEIDRCKLQVVNKIGDGEFGEIQLCRLEQRLVAVKTLYTASPEEEYSFQREMRVLGSLKHPNVVEVIGVCTRQRPIGCVMEYMQNGDLKSYMNKLERIDTLTALSLSTSLAAGLSYLESRGYVHRDIAARSCLVDHEGTAKIADFGMARSLYSDDYYKTKGHALPIRWMAWESVLMNKFSLASDAWSFGVTVWEIMGACREKPFGEYTDNDVMENLQYCSQFGKLKHVLQQPALCPPILYSQVLQKCWLSEPSQRPSFQHIHLQLQTLMHSHM